MDCGADGGGEIAEYSESEKKTFNTCLPQRRRDAAFKKEEILPGEEGTALYFKNS